MGFIIEACRTLGIANAFVSAALMNPHPVPPSSHLHNMFIKCRKIGFGFDGFLCFVDVHSIISIVRQYGYTSKDNFRVMEKDILLSCAKDVDLFNHTYHLSNHGDFLSPSLAASKCLYYLPVCALAGGWSRKRISQKELWNHYQQMNEGEVERCKSCELVYHKACFKKMTTCPCGVNLGPRSMRNPNASMNEVRVAPNNLLLDTESKSSIGFLTGLLSKASTAKFWVTKDNDTIISMGSLPSSSL
ncbi:phox domain, Multihem cytochrome [Artemisia annua]|uniref:Phox domain, Multihem cytochrome n=1 Tax=Artemisia annua TaxID=35608 RepID=A0A2U1KK13_ARTAN|nr:phox domain, Multihem cytochrome [Artemisia annua]